MIQAPGKGMNDGPKYGALWNMTEYDLVSTGSPRS